MRSSLRLLAVCSVLLATVSFSATACQSASRESHKTELPKTMPADFAFSGAYGVGAKNQIDTYKGTFTKDIVNPSKPNPTVQLRLTTGELSRLYGDLVSMHILDYPSQFPPPEDRGAKNGTMVHVSPSHSYVLRITAAGAEKVVTWDDDANLMTPEAKALRAWFRELESIIQSKPEYKAMPPAEGGYL